MLQPHDPREIWSAGAGPPTTGRRLFVLRGLLPGDALAPPPGCHHGEGREPLVHPFGSTPRLRDGACPACSLCDPFSRRSRAAGTGLQLIEDGIHLVVAALVVLLAGLLTVGVVHDVITPVQGPYREDTGVLSALDNGLGLFIVAELLHTVRLMIRNQTLDAEPFLVVGLIAGIRKVLIVTAEA
ncbi:phosphate-starvation-inducible PsiE family protein [Streptomyces sp. NPDC054804]